MESPELRQLRRVSVGSLVQVVLITLAAYAIVTMLSGVDLDELVDTLSGAIWGWVVLGLVLGQITIGSETVSVQGASPRRLSLGPLAVLQAAISFVKLAVPSTAARLAMVVRYFQKHGFPPVTSTSFATIETVARFIVQALLLVAVLVVGVGSESVDTSAATGDGGSGSESDPSRLVVAVVTGTVLFAVLPSFRRRVIERVRPCDH